MKESEKKLRQVIKIIGLYIIVVSGILVSCQDKRDSDLIQSLAKENKELEQARLEMETNKKIILGEMETHYVTMANSIDPKKKKDYENDLKLKSELKKVKEEMERIMRQFEGNYNNLALANKNNGLFIELTKGSAKGEKEILTEWRQNVSVSKGIIEKNKLLQMELNKMVESNKKLIASVIKTYGIATK